MNAIQGPNDRSIFARLSRRRLAPASPSGHAVSSPGRGPAADDLAVDDNFYFETTITSPAMQLSVWELLNDDEADPGHDDDDEALDDDVLAPGQTESVAYWTNEEGQRLLRAFDQGAGASRLGSWLSATFPNLYGPSSGHNLAGKSNTYLAAFVRRSARAPEPRLEAQVLAVALAIYATGAPLGGPTAASFGFRVSPCGVGACLCNVGTFGAPFAAADGSALTILQLLQALDRRSSAGTPLAGRDDLRRQAHDLLELINRFGDATNH